MIFSELYSAYYNTVAKIMEAAFNPEATEKDLQRCVMEEAFSESVLTILPALKSGKWPLLHEDLSPVLLHKPTMPLTNLEKRWLKAIAEDPRVKLFDVAFPELNDVEPLFTRNDYKIYDQYSDGDPFEDEAYIEHFRLMLYAIQSDRPVQMTMTTRCRRLLRCPWDCISESVIPVSSITILSSFLLGRSLLRSRARPLPRGWSICAPLTRLPIQMWKRSLI